MTTIRSRMMHRILRLHAQANRQALREVRATARATCWAVACARSAWRPAPWRRA